MLKDYAPLWIFLFALVLYISARSIFFHQVNSFVSNDSKKFNKPGYDLTDPFVTKTPYFNQ